MATFADLGPWKGNDNLIGLDSRIKTLIVVILWKENIDNVSQPQKTAQCWKSLILKIFLTEANKKFWIKYPSKGLEENGDASPFKLLNILLSD